MKKSVLILLCTLLILSACTPQPLPELNHSELTRRERAETTPEPPEPEDPLITLFEIFEQIHEDKLTEIIRIYENGDDYIIDAAIVGFTREGHGDDNRQIPSTEYMRHTFRKSGDFDILSIENITGVEETGWLKAANTFYELYIEPYIQKHGFLNQIDLVLFNHPYVQSVSARTEYPVRDAVSVDLFYKVVSKIDSSEIENREYTSVDIGLDGFIRELYSFFKKSY